MFSPAPRLLLQIPELPASKVPPSLTMGKSTVVKDEEAVPVPPFFLYMRRAIVSTLA